MASRPVSNLMRFRGPLADSYPAAVALVVFALIPYLALSAAINPLEPILSKSLPLSRQALELTNGMANAAYAFGTVIAVQFAGRSSAPRLPLRSCSGCCSGRASCRCSPSPAWSCWRVAVPC